MEKNWLVRKVYDNNSTGKRSCDRLSLKMERYSGLNRTWTNKKEEEEISN